MKKNKSKEAQREEKEAMKSEQEARQQTQSAASEPSGQSEQSETSEPEKGNKQDAPQEKEASEALKTAEERLLRLTAEFQNYKKRIERERLELVKFSNEALITELLPVLDNFERAVQNMEEGKVKDGVLMTQNSLFAALEKFGLSKMEATGSPFNHNEHHAVATEEGETPDIVTAVLQEGYKIGEKVIRPAMVKVSK